MEVARALDFVRANHDAVLATRKGNGDPQLSPITVGVDGDGKVVVSTRQTAMKTKNVRRDPRVSLCVLSGGFYGDWIQIEGKAEIVELPEAMEGLIDYYRSLSGEHPDWDDYRAAMERDRRVLLRIAVEKAGPDRSG